MLKQGPTIGEISILEVPAYTNSGPASIVIERGNHENKCTLRVLGDMVLTTPDGADAPLESAVALRNDGSVRVYGVIRSEGKAEVHSHVEPSIGNIVARGLVVGGSEKFCLSAVDQDETEKGTAYWMIGELGLSVADGATAPGVFVESGPSELPAKVFAQTNFTISAALGVKKEYEYDQSTLELVTCQWSSASGEYGYDGDRPHTITVTGGFWENGYVNVIGTGSIVMNFDTEHNPSPFFDDEPGESGRYADTDRSDVNYGINNSVKLYIADNASIHRWGCGAYLEMNDSAQLVRIGRAPAHNNGNLFPWESSQSVVFAFTDEDADGDSSPALELAYSTFYDEDTMNVVVYDAGDYVLDANGNPVATVRPKSNRDHVLIRGLQVGAADNENGRSTRFIPIKLPNWADGLYIVPNQDYENRYDLVLRMKPMTIKVFAR